VKTGKHQPGLLLEAVKVVDIFGNDTMGIIEFFIFLE